MIYLDHNATTPMHEQVFAAMEPFLRGAYGNPSGVYSIARESRQAIETAREQLAELVNAHPGQVVFTSGGTEANNMALKGAVLGMDVKQLFYSAVEHPSVRDVARYIHHKGWAEAQPLPVEASGELALETLTQLVPPKSLVSVMWANNETGVINDIAGMARAQDIVLHSDAVQAVGKVDVDFKVSGVQMMTLSSHKLYGPKGVGALVVDKALLIDPLLHGGGQEKGRRSGTENVAAIVGFGMAAELARQNRQKDFEHLRLMRDKLETALAELDGVQVFSRDVERLPNTTFFSVPGIDGETLLMQLDQMGFAVASGSACASKSGKASHVLLAMGVDEVRARGAIRVSLGRNNTASEIEAFLNALSQIVTGLKNMSVMPV